MLYGFAQTGGVLEIGGKRLVIQGRNLQQLAEFEAFWLQIIGAPLDEIRLFMARREDIQTPAIAGSLIKNIRLIWLGDKEDQKAKLASNPEGRLFSLWQAVRENSPDITLSWLEQAVSETIEEREHPADFWLEVERCIAIAAGRDELGLLGGIHRPSSSGDGISLEAFMAKLVNEGKWRPDDVKKLTGHALNMYFSAQQDLDTKLESEIRNPKSFESIMRRNYRVAAVSFLNGRRWDDKQSLKELDAADLFAMACTDKKVRKVMRCQTCLKEKRSGESLEIRRIEKKKQVNYQVFCKDCENKARSSSTMDGAVAWWKDRMEVLIDENDLPLPVIIKDPGIAFPS